MDLFINLEFLELFLGCSGLRDFEYIETHCLAEWSTFTNSYCVSNSHVSIKSDKKVNC